MRDFITTILPAFQKHNKFILIPEVIYDKLLKATHSKKDFKDCTCPVCSGSLFTYHCKYQKYYYSELIVIFRVECLICRSTHALIPEFSLPGSSIGTKEADMYMNLRTKGISQQKASHVFTHRGMNRNYGVNLEKKFLNANRKATVLFPDKTDILHNPCRLFNTRENPKTSVILYVNHLFLARGYNPLYFSRNNILRIREIKTGKRFPLNKQAVLSGPVILDSG